MRKSLVRLMHEANASAIWRGHVLGTWTGDGPRVIAECTRCGRTAHVDAEPAPNGIDVGGEAVAVGCDR